MWWSIGGGIIIFALGMFIFLKPGLIWKLTEEWKSYRADEPSEFYLKTTKIGGILFALFGIIMIMLPVILGNKFQLCAQLRVCSQAGGIPVYPRFSQPDNSESWDDAGNGI